MQAKSFGDKFCDCHSNIYDGASVLGSDKHTCEHNGWDNNTTEVGVAPSKTKGNRAVGGATAY